MLYMYMKYFCLRFDYKEVMKYITIKMYYETQKKALLIILFFCALLACNDLMGDLFTYNFFGLMHE